MFTWIPRSAIRTPIIARHRLDQLLQCPLIARLMALAQSGCHDPAVGILVLLPMLTKEKVVLIHRPLEHRNHQHATATTKQRIRATSKEADETHVGSIGIYLRRSCMAAHVRLILSPMEKRRSSSCGVATGSIAVRRSVEVDAANALTLQLAEGRAGERLSGIATRCFEPRCLCRSSLSILEKKNCFISPKGN